MTEISVEFSIVTPGSLDPDMHFGLEVKWLNMGLKMSVTSQEKTGLFLISEKKMLCFLVGITGVLQ